MKNKQDIIGLQATDKVTKMKGVIIDYAEYLHQGPRVDLSPIERKTDGSILDTFAFDLCQVEVGTKRIIDLPKFVDTDVNLGDEVVCKISGYKGTVTGKTWHMNGCIQFLVQEKYDAKLEKGFSRGSWVAANNLEVTKATNAPVKKKEYGGPGDAVTTRTRNF